LIKVKYKYIFILIGIKVNNSLIEKFLIEDSSLDNTEEADIKSELLKYNFIKSKINTSKRIGNITIFNLIIDLNMFIKNEPSGCFIF
jgi:hypothetical protein